MRTLMSKLLRVVAGVIVLPAVALAEEPAMKSAVEEAPLEYVRMSTSMGDIVIELNREKAPISVENFLAYADQGFYEGTIFHRVMSTFMIQGGGFTADLVQKQGRPPIKNEWQNGLKNMRGAVAMARTSVHDSATSQFFINVVDNGALDLPRDGAAYAVFGRVIDGMETVDRIRNTAVQQKDAAFTHLPVETVVIKSVKRVPVADLTESLTRARKADEDRAALLKAGDASAMQAGIELVRSKVSGDVNVDSGVKSPSGLWHLDQVVGSGKEASRSSHVKVHYTGWLTNGTKFDSSVDRGEPITFPLTGVIKGWTEGVSGMKAGGRRFLVIPPDLGYGERGSPPVIPPKSTLVFEVELLDVVGP